MRFLPGGPPPAGIDPALLACTLERRWLTGVPSLERRSLTVEIEACVFTTRIRKPGGLRHGGGGGWP
ncbi:MAG: hypothetical protein LW698_11525 [Planctomycetaceae bacterium]|nr:hypothetical protein [Planctomycetaceae bacterium]